MYTHTVSLSLSHSHTHKNTFTQTMENYSALKKKINVAIPDNMNETISKYVLFG